MSASSKMLGRNSVHAVAEFGVSSAQLGYKNPQTNICIFKEISSLPSVLNAGVTEGRVRKNRVGIGEEGRERAEESTDHGLKKGLLARW
jgi:hypothetical protein